MTLDTNFVFQQLVDMVRHQNEIFITIIGIILALFGFFQWKLSDKQLDNVKAETKEELRKEISVLKDSLRNDKFDQMTSLGAIILDKLALFLTVQNPVIKTQYVNDIENYLDRLRLLTIENHFKIHTFNLIREEATKNLDNNKVTMKARRF